MLIWCKSARHGRALFYGLCHVNQYIWQEIPELRCLVKLNLITYLCTYAYLLHMVIMRGPSHPAVSLKTYMTIKFYLHDQQGNMSLISNFKTGFLDSYSILLLLLIGLPWRLLKHMHSQLYTLQEVSPWCDIADVFDAPLNWFAWSKRNSDTLHELLILSTPKQDTSTQIFFSKNTFHYNRVVHTMCMWR